MENSDTSSATHNAVATRIQERTSPTFPAGQGDIALVTIDNTVFYVHRAVLRYSSHVFETILENGGGEEDESSQPRLKIETDASTLDHLLAFAHSNMSSPSIDDVNVLAAIFRAAKRYEMDGVLQQLRKSLMEVKMVHDVMVQPLFVKAPLAVLVMSYAFDCPAEGRLALRECIKGRLEDHVAGAVEFDIPAELISTILRLRQERETWCLAKLNSVRWPTSNFYYCACKCGDWRVQVMSQLRTKPQFETLKQVFSIPRNCASGHVIPQPVDQTTLDSWTLEISQLEQVIPTLPRLSR